jgi:radical SAM protein with 4Fe4S-binding SPASM domain
MEETLSNVLKKIIKKALFFLPPEFFTKLKELLSFSNSVTPPETVILKPADKVDLFLSLSTKCNYRCVFCNRDVNQLIINLKDIYHFDELIGHARMVDITGYGEITIHPDFFEILSSLSKAEIPVRFVTNGSSLTKRHSDLLIQSRIEEIVFSLNSLNSEMYRKIHGGASDLSKTMHNLQYILSLHPKFPVRLSFVITNWNLHEIPDIINFAKKHKNNIASTSCMGLTPTLKNMYPDEIVIENSEENRKYLESMRKMVTDNDVTVSIFNLENQSTTDVPISQERLENMIRSCDWVYNKSFIEPDGSVMPCCWWVGNHPFGNIKNNSFSEIWHGKLYEELRREIKNGSTKYCSNCRREN